MYINPTMMPTHFICI